MVESAEQGNYSALQQSTARYSTVCVCCTACSILCASSDGVALPHASASPRARCASSSSSSSSDFRRRTRSHQAWEALLYPHHQSLLSFFPPPPPHPAPPPPPPPPPPPLRLPLLLPLSRLLTLLLLLPLPSSPSSSSLPVCKPLCSALLRETVTAAGSCFVTVTSCRPPALCTRSTLSNSTPRPLSCIPLVARRFPSHSARLLLPLEPTLTPPPFAFLSPMVPTPCPCPFPPLSPSPPPPSPSVTRFPHSPSPLFPPNHPLFFPSCASSTYGTSPGPPLLPFLHPLPPLVHVSSIHRKLLVPQHPGERRLPPPCSCPGAASAVAHGQTRAAKTGQGKEGRMND